MGTITQRAIRKKVKHIGGEQAVTLRKGGKGSGYIATAPEEREKEKGQELNIQSKKKDTKLESGNNWAPVRKKNYVKEKKGL